ncbi:hypothetical protein [Hyalangium versicolor]|uniref:hypothetical protein n=1 Tax=Hyalangium versicolor TaxID=2861190 RepID=UPI001CCEC44A|nr:hypothetical protein [Hyalangium versicolor]
MTDYLQVNGVPLACTASEYEPVRLGEVTRSFNGAPRSSVRTRKRDYRFTTGLLTLAEAELVRALVEGEGHVWNFEDYSVASSRGLVPDYVKEAYLEDGNTRYGDWKLVLSWVGTMRWQTLLPSTWTLMGWHAQAGVDVRYTHYTLRSDGAKWSDGGRDNSRPVPFEVLFGGSVRVFSMYGGEEYLDELVALPYAVPDTWVPRLYALHAARPFPPLPFVHAGGEGLPSGGLTCMGLTGTGRRTGLAVGGSFTTGEVLDFTLYGS